MKNNNNELYDHSFFDKSNIYIPSGIDVTSYPIYGCYEVSLRMTRRIKPTESTSPNNGKSFNTYVFLFFIGEIRKSPCI